MVKTLTNTPSAILCFNFPLSVDMTNAKSSRPLGVIVVGMIIIWFSLWNGLRMGMAIFFLNTLEKYHANPFYLFASGVLWMIMGLFLIWTLWQRKTWSRLATIEVAVGYTTWYWLDRLILREPHSNWPFSLTTNFILLSLIFFSLFTRKTRQYFTRKHERKSENPTSS
jgi:hypothetical protein